MNNKFFVNEDGEFEGDPFCKSSEQRYVNYIVSAIPSLWIDEESRDDDNIGISIERYLSTKQLKYSWENEVRLFINCKYLDDASISEKQNKYTARVFNEYNTKKVINFNLPLDATYQLKSNTIFKSVMCHPKMSNDNRIYIRKLMNENRMETVPIVKSTFE